MLIVLVLVSWVVAENKISVCEMGLTYIDSESVPISKINYQATVKMPAPSLPGLGNNLSSIGEYGKTILLKR